MSSTGDGEPPDTAIPFWKYLVKCSNTKELGKVSFAILGLGDSNYTSFMQNPRNFDEKLQQAGAKRIFERGEADDAVG